MRGTRALNRARLSATFGGSERSWLTLHPSVLLGMLSAPLLVPMGKGLSRQKSPLTLKDQAGQPIAVLVRSLP